MGRLNVYIPDALQSEARELGLNISKLAQQAIKDAIVEKRRRIAETEGVSFS